MASSITNVSDINHVTDVKKIKVLSYSEELSKVNKIKYNLSIAYFAGLVVLLTFHINYQLIPHIKYKRFQ